MNHEISPEWSSPTRPSLGQVLQVRPDDPSRADVAALLEQHLAFTSALSPPEDVHALDLAGLSADDISFFSLRVDGELAAIGALRSMAAGTAELKSMHTAAAFRGRGYGRLVLDHLLAVARAAGVTRVLLETGSMDGFAAARRLYASAGFVECGPFPPYAESPNSTFMSLEL